MGPISPYHFFKASLDRPNHPVVAARQCWLRFLTGLTKFMFLARLADQLSYQGLLLDAHPHAWIDMPVAMVAYYFSYMNFSGWCDMAIGTADWRALRCGGKLQRPHVVAQSSGILDALAHDADRLHA